MNLSTSGRGRGKPSYRYYVCGKAVKRGRKTCPRASLPADDIESFVLKQLQLFRVDETLLNSICNQVRSQMSKKQNDLEKERRALVAEVSRLEKTISVLSTPNDNGDADGTRLDSLASCNEQLARRQQRLIQIDTELAKAGRPLPSRVEILKSAQDLETLWEKMTTGERSRFMQLLIERIDHDPLGGNVAITLTNTGREFLSTEERQ